MCVLLLTGCQIIPDDFSVYAVIRHSCLFQYVYSVWAMFVSTTAELSQMISPTVKPQAVSCSEVRVMSLPLMMTQWLNNQLGSFISHLTVIGVGLRFERCYSTSCRWSWELCSRAVCRPGRRLRAFEGVNTIFWQSMENVCQRTGEGGGERWWWKGNDVTERKYQPKHKCGTNGTNWDRTWGLSEKSYWRHCQVEKMTGISVKLTIRKSQHLERVCNCKK